MFEAKCLVAQRFRQEDLVLLPCEDADLRDPTQLEVTRDRQDPGDRMDMADLSSRNTTPASSVAMHGAVAARYRRDENG